MASPIVKELLERELSRKGITYFIGGSSRFGYDVPDSDLDVVVFDDSDNNGNLRSIVRDLGGAWIPVPKKRNYMHELTEVKILGGKVHFIIFSKRGDYLLLKKEHEEVTSFLRENPVLVEFIRWVKSTGTLTGTTIYNAIKDLMSKKFEVPVQEKPVNQRLLRVEP